MSFTELDSIYMARAIELAKQGRFTTTPNPNVGCVLVKDGHIVGEGFHQLAGQGHAEVNALAVAGDNAKGATAYVTLEPCSHYGRTPPCAEGLKAAGVSKVIAAMVDPNPAVSGRGLQILADAGIDVASGLLEQQARDLNKGFLKRMETGLPFVTCKMACSLDGKTALNNGQSKWITGPQARQDVQAFRAQSCAILSGADTVISDNAKLNVRTEELPFAMPTSLPIRQPTRVIIDSQNRLTPDLALFSIESPVIIFTTQLDNQQQWPHFVKHEVVAANKNKVDLSAVLARLAELQFNHIWLEAGATLAGAFAQQDLIDEYIVYIAPKLIGDMGKSLLNFAEVTAMGDVTQLTFTDTQIIGDDIRLTAYKAKQATHTEDKE
ncbi:MULTISPECIES: bifunctional diaminohydroxyphosphoribosylaminopyrimidine deaminase/5-amino-6-(5-phosphoribosylamino)uracil reductase RibD [Pseudoalteromonas]|jgi:diaminohydroxyphosphoribosylaminopyrimidine deaminase/5-amino-6-(5-phosphoribosylamino)uracil reductase|uniref:Riboflavin biosynthesis protein RibD n=1 Tax=Pseudoalteromonas lipolytica TaxID=570156 RepID=A0AAD0S181_9GAMM|nr:MULTISPECIES: bifunctional diaminohydroxyphosphoribosylaminopyrimidine deaminase/5-amino-6-(5-phosphoribosylamino)uracil reductase RibD [Pseudoalteromonas]AXV66077.1 bifunctional diaminohydroxyphosphoribosylaminopyrimidine deaminase/5-amino-6-(5-phosphoribosylamino)uracil reductase RibD [Pseudoalteromonas donghaensis]EWH07999.1 5-amino-6-(5-phosphoribosylamino)uracil reductase [Pseudoalteromonas lipolytica SCSIO 04301]MBE0350426.1 diaminohydroxyphosphoribosylaminopyrimidine deaminase / 5-amin|tara:strand:- start:743 stop:1882 length:1140 start_codon:yes stop_codon:yes gene_type:complete